MNKPAAAPVIWVRGKRVGLGPLRADLVSRYWEWENDPRAILGYGRQVPDSLENRRVPHLARPRSPRTRPGRRGHPAYPRLRISHHSPADDLAQGPRTQHPRHPRLRRRRLQASRTAPPGRVLAWPALRRAHHGRAPRRLPQTIPLLMKRSHAGICSYRDGIPSPLNWIDEVYRSPGDMPPRGRRPGSWCQWTGAR